MRLKRGSKAVRNVFGTNTVAVIFFFARVHCPSTSANMMPHLVDLSGSGAVAISEVHSLCVRSGEACHVRQQRISYLGDPAQ